MFYPLRETFLYMELVVHIIVGFFPHTTISYF